MKKYRILVLLLILVSCLTGCSDAGMASGKDLKPSDIAVQAYDVQTVGGNVFVLRPGTEGVTLYQQCNDTEQAIWVCPEGKPVYSEYHRQYFCHVDGRLVSYDPVTGRTETLWETGHAEHHPVQVTEHYVLLRHNQESDWLVNVETGQTTEAENLWSNSYVLDSEGDRLLVWEASTYTLGFYDCETLQFEPVLTDDTDPARHYHSAVVVNNRIYAVDQEKTLKCLTQQEDGSWSMLQTISSANESVLAVAAADNTLYVVSKKDNSSNLVLNLLLPCSEERMEVQRWLCSEESLNEGNVVLSAEDGLAACVLTSEGAVITIELPKDPAVTR